MGQHDEDLRARQKAMHLSAEAHVRRAKLPPSPERFSLSEQIPSRCGILPNKIAEGRLSSSSAHSPIAWDFLRNWKSGHRSR
jgi:hypothetical protein